MHPLPLCAGRHQRCRPTRESPKQHFLITIIIVPSLTTIPTKDTSNSILLISVICFGVQGLKFLGWCSRPWAADQRLLLLSSSRTAKVALPKPENVQLRPSSLALLLLSLPRAAFFPPLSCRPCRRGRRRAAAFFKSVSVSQYEEDVPAALVLE